MVHGHLVALAVLLAGEGGRAVAAREGALLGVRDAVVDQAPTHTSKRTTYNRVLAN